MKRLTDDFMPGGAERAEPYKCAICGGVEKLARWQEHDDNDQPEYRMIVLCAHCSQRVIEPHPRLYRWMSPHEPYPGAMAVCVGCKWQAGIVCKNPQAKVNGGPGIEYDQEPPLRVHTDGRDKHGKRFSKWETIYSGPVRGCSGKET